jgi:purine nucleosidase
LSARAAINLIIDTDPGADDVVALLLALASPEQLNVMALTTVAGNVPIEKTTRNARLAREWADRGEVPVHAGAAQPLERAAIHAAHIHGNEGLPGVPVYEPQLPAASANAVGYLIETLRAAPVHSVTLAMLGPQTNLALALAEAPDIVQGLKEVIVMGGAHFNGGNVTPVAEFNLYADPHAARVVLESTVPLVYVPLDLTHRILTSETRLAQLAALGNRAGRLVQSILHNYVKADMQHYGLPGGPVHDAVVIAWLLMPHLFSGKQVPLWIDCREGPTFGQTIPDWYGKTGAAPRALWLDSGDAQGFFDLLCERLARLP